MFLTELELGISPESTHQYKEIAYNHLDKENSILGVALAGLDSNGDEIFGIRLISNEGEEEWYDPEEDGSHTLMGWNNEKDAYFELENKVLPQLGYAIYQKDLQLFHKFMGN